MYSSTKDSQPSGDAWGMQSSKEAPMIASAMQPWQIHLGARTILILHQDDAVMFLNCVKTDSAAPTVQLLTDCLPTQTLHKALEYIILACVMCPNALCSKHSSECY